MSSRTVGSTLFTIMQLRATNVLTLALVFNWSFSPLGAQAFLRMLDSRLHTSFHPSSVTWLSNLATSKFSYMVTAGGVTAGNNQLFLTRTATLYNDLISAPKIIKLDPMDIWGNVRIPYLGENTLSDWKNISTDPTDVQFSSLSGIPLDYSGERNTTFTLESAYIYTCDVQTLLDSLPPEMGPATSIGSGTSDQRLYQSFVEYAVRDRNRPRVPKWNMARILLREKVCRL